jgi:hypothetical protein
MYEIENITSRIESKGEEVIFTSNSDLHKE